MDCVGCTPPVPLCWNSDAGSLLLRIQAGYEADPLYREHAQREHEQHGLTLAADGIYERGSAIAVPAHAELRRDSIRELHNSPYVGHLAFTALTA